MTDEEGAICDECGSRVGAMGCCASARGRELEIATEQTRAEAWKHRAERAEAQVEKMRGSLNAIERIARGVAYPAHPSCCPSCEELVGKFREAVFACRVQFSSAIPEKEAKPAMRQE